MSEERLDIRFIIPSISFIVLVVFASFYLGVTLDPPTREEWGSLGAFYWLFSICVAIISIALVAFIAGFFRINKKTRRATSVSSYLAIIIVLLLCESTYEYYQPQDYYWEFGNLLIAVFWYHFLFLIPILVLFLILVNRIFIMIGAKSHELVS